MRGSTIRHRLSRVGMTQVELARLLKVSPQTVNKTLRVTNVWARTLECLCGALHVPVTFFYDDETFHQGEDAGATSKTYRVKFPMQEGEGSIYAQRIDSYEVYEDYEENEYQWELYELSALLTRLNTVPDFDEFKVSNRYNSATLVKSQIPDAGQIRKGQKANVTHCLAPRWLLLEVA